MEQILEQLGYLRSESLVYSALLELGTSSAGQIAKKTRLNRVSVYKALDKLIKEGLASYVIKANRKTFKPVSPEKLRKIIKEKKNQLDKFELKIPELLKLYKSKQDKIRSDIYEGVKGAKAIWENLLEETKKGDEWLILGAPKSAETLGGYFKELNKRRAKKGVKMRIIYNKNARELIKVREKQPLTKVRVMEEQYITPASIEILRDNVLIVIYEPQIIIFATKNKQVAKSFKQYFDLLWRGLR